MEARKKQRRIFLAVSAAFVAAILIVSAEVLLPFVLGLLVAYVLLPAVLRVEALRVPRWAAILLVYAVTIGAIAGFISLVVPSLISEGRALSRDLPHQVQRAQEEYLPVIDARLKQWSGQPTEPVNDAADAGADDDGDDAAEAGKPRAPRPDLQIRPNPGGGYDVTLEDGVVLRKTGDETWRVERAPDDGGAFSSEAAIKKGVGRATKYVAENMGELIKVGQQIVAAVSRGIFNLFMTLMLGGYMMYTHEKILDFFRDLVAYESQPSFDRLVRRLDRGLSGVVRGQLIICCVNGVLSAIGFWLFDLKYWPIMAFIGAVGSLIPIFGSIISTIPAVAIGLTQSPGTAVAVLAWVVGIHQLEANFLNPKIIGDAAKIHPVLVVFSLLVGEHFFQIKGALFAVPCLSILQTFFLHFREVTMGLADPMASIPPAAPVRSPSAPPAPAEPVDATVAEAGASKATATQTSARKEGAGRGVVVRGPTPVPRTKTSRSGDKIGTTLPSGTRIEDVLDDAESAEPEPGRRAIDVTLTSPMASPMASPTATPVADAGSEAEARDTEPHAASAPSASEPDVSVVSSSSPATVQPTGSERPPAPATAPAGKTPRDA